MDEGPSDAALRAVNDARAALGLEPLTAESIRAEGLVARKTWGFMSVRSADDARMVVGRDPLGDAANTEGETDDGG